jgi:hypothetical protein
MYNQTVIPLAPNRSMSDTGKFQKNFCFFTRTVFVVENYKKGAILGKMNSGMVEFVMKR